MDQSHEGIEGFGTAATAAWEVYQDMIWREIEQRKLPPEVGTQLCNALSMVAWYPWY